MCTTAKNFTHHASIYAIYSAALLNLGFSASSAQHLASSIIALTHVLKSNKPANLLWWLSWSRSYHANSTPYRELPSHTGRLLGGNLWPGVAAQTRDSIHGIGSHSKKPDMGFETCCTVLPRRSTICTFQDNPEISFMDTNEDLEIMSHVGHLRTTPEFVRGLWIDKHFFSDRYIQ